MKNFIVHNTVGEIIRCGVCQDGDLQLQAQEGEFVIEAVGDFNTGYVADGEFVQYTAEELQRKAQPKQGFVWSVTTRDWVDVRNLDAAKDQAWERIKRARTKQENAGFIYNNILYDSDPVSVQRIAGAAQLALLAQLANQPFSINWTVADNSVVTLDAQGMIAVGQALGVHLDTTFQKGRTYRNQIAAQTSIAALDAIDWE
jgi:hypothetical protein